MNLIFDFPVTAFGFQNDFGISRQAGDKVTDLYFDFVA
jgi:hypothetical protein